MKQFLQKMCAAALGLSSLIVGQQLQAHTGRTDRPLTAYALPSTAQEQTGPAFSIPTGRKEYSLIYEYHQQGSHTFIRYIENFSEGMQIYVQVNDPTLIQQIGYVQSKDRRNIVPLPLDDKGGTWLPTEAISIESSGNSDTGGGCNTK